MTALALLTTLRDHGVRLTPNVTIVRAVAPQDALTPALPAALREHKQELLDLLEEWSERAALIEFDGRVPRAEAECLAWACLRGETRTLQTAVVT